MHPWIIHVLRNARELTKSQKPYISSFPDWFLLASDDEPYLPEPLIAFAATAVISDIYYHEPPADTVVLGACCLGRL